jgi:hypothetical protein
MRGRIPGGAAADAAMGQGPGSRKRARKARASNRWLTDRSGCKVYIDERGQKSTGAKAYKKWKKR